MFRQPRKFAQELRAYHDWLPQLDATPDLLRESAALSALLVSAVPGRNVDDVSLTSAQALETYRQGGAFLRALHTLPFTDADPLPFARAYEQRAKGWLARADGLTELNLASRVAKRAAEAAELLRELNSARVPCQRDYTPRNWFVEVQGDTLKTYVIDFEHAGPQVWFKDVGRLWGEVWPTRPDLEAAFFNGYGRTMTVVENQFLQKLSAHSAMSTVVWAREHHDAAFER